MSQWKKFPKFTSHDLVSCFCCNKRLDTRVERHGYPEGRFQKMCHDCNMYSWYDIEEPVDKSIIAQGERNCKIESEGHVFVGDGTVGTPKGEYYRYKCPFCDGEFNSRHILKWPMRRIEHGLSCPWDSAWEMRRSL